MIFTLHYNDGKKEKEKAIEINFASQWFLKEHRKLKMLIADFMQKYNDLEKNVRESTDAILNKDFEKIKQLEKERPAIIEAVKEFHTNGVEDEIIDKRLKLIEYLYESNGLDFEGRDWWEHHVRPDECNRILQDASMIDFEESESKKKALISSMRKDFSRLFQNTGDQLTENTSTIK